LEPRPKTVEFAILTRGVGQCHEPTRRRIYFFDLVVFFVVDFLLEDDFLAAAFFAMALLPPFSV
jgi:hypothetical protein